MLEAVAIIALVLSAIALGLTCPHRRAGAGTVEGTGGRMKTLSIIMSLLLIMAAFMYGYAGVIGFFVLGISYLNSMLYILMMVASIMVSINLFVIAQEEE